MDGFSDEQLTRIARALSDPLRLRILDLVARGSTEPPPGACCSIGMCVCDIQEALDLKQSKVSYHLKELKNAGLLKERKEGKWNYYSVQPEVFQIFCRELGRRYFWNANRHESGDETVDMDRP